MVHLLSATIGVALVLAWAVGVAKSGTPWMTWLLGVAGLVAIGMGVIDREQVSRETRAQSLVCFGLMLYAAAFLGWSRHVPGWQSSGALAAATAALVGGLAALFDAAAALRNPHERRRPHAS